MRPKLRDDLLYVDVDGGVYVEWPLGSLTLPEPPSYVLLDSVVAYLDGSHTLDALAGALTEPQRTAVLDLIALLHQRGLVRDLENGQPDGLTAQERAAFAEEIAFIEADGGNGGQRFERFRNGRVLILGEEGPLATEVTSALRGAGVREQVTVDRVPDDALDSVLAGYDAVLHVAQRPLLRQAAAVSRAAARAGIRATHAVIVRGNAWIGPVGDGCWECAWLRLLGTLSAGSSGWSDHQLEDRPDALPEPFLSGPLTSLIGAVSSFGHFRSVTGAGLEGTHAQLIRVKLRSAECTALSFVAHPRCASHPVPLRWYDVDAAPVPAPGQEEPGVDDIGELQAVAGLDEGAHDQLSVCLVEATVADLTGKGWGPRQVVASGQTNADARLAAVVRAVELSLEVAHADQRVTAGAGRSWAEAVGRALLRHCHRLPRPPWQPLTVDGVLAEALRTLDSDAELVAAATDAFATVAVRSGAAVLAEVSALTVDSAAAAALARAVALLRGTRMEYAELPGELGVDEWVAAAPALSRRLHDQGWRVDVAPADDPALPRLVPYTAVARLVPTGEAS